MDTSQYRIAAIYPISTDVRLCDEFLDALVESPNLQEVVGISDIDLYAYEDDFEELSYCVSQCCGGNYIVRIEIQVPTKRTSWLYYTIDWKEISDLSKLNEICKDEAMKVLNQIS